MYTQCPDCGTVFRVTARALRAAEGRVRCGICSVSFSALEYLSEQPLPQASGIQQAEDTITVEEMPGTEFIELSASGTRASQDPGSDSGEYESVAAAADEDRQAAADGDEQLDAPEAGGGDAPDADLEFHGTVEDLERMFVAIDARAGPPARSAQELEGDDDDRVVEFRHAIDRIAASDLSGIEVVEEAGSWATDEQDDGPPPDPAQIASVLSFRRPGDLDPTDEFPILVLDEKDEIGDALEHVGLDREDGMDELAAARRALAAAGDGAETGSPDDESGSTGSGGQARSPLYGSPRIPIPQELRRDAALAADEIFALRTPAEPAAGAPRWPWIAATALLLLGLGAQAAHHWRDDLVRHPVAGPWLLRTYDALGMRLAAPADLAAFELRQLGAASDATQAGRLRVRASIVNRASFAQPFPLLRLSLQDRFGTTIGTRDLEPAEYLPGGDLPASGLMAPGQRADAEVVFVDPGRDAVGFELDLCLGEGPDLRCSSDLQSGRS